MQPVPRFLLAALGAAVLAACSGSGSDAVTVLGYSVTISSAPPTTAPIGTAIPIGFTITENESDGTSRPAAGKTFTATVTGGGGTIDGASSTTLTSDATGTVSTTWILGASVGAQIVRGSVSASQYLDVTVTATALPATQLAFATAPSTSAQSGVALVVQPTVQLKDAAGDPVAQASVAVTVAIDAGGGTLAGTLTVNTNASGAAVFGGLALSGLAGTRSLKFTATPIATPLSVSASVVLNAGAATQLSLTTTPPAIAVLGLVLTQSPTVQLRDASGNPVSQSLVPVTVTIDAGGGTLGASALTVNTDVNGVAVFTGLTISGTAGSRTLKFAATLGGQNAGVTSSGVNVVAATISSVSFAGSSRVKLGQSYGYAVTQRLADGSTVQHAVAWSILVPGTATITGSGVLGALLPGTITIVATIDGVAWVNTISGYDWVSVTGGPTTSTSLAADVAVTGTAGTPEFPVLSFSCTGGVFGVTVALSGIITGNGAVTYTGAGAVNVSENWTQSGPSLKTLTYPGATNLIRKTFASTVATNWNQLFTFNFTFNESPLIARATAWQMNGISAAIAPVIAACPGTALR